MKNPLTFRVESWIGAVLLVGVAGFFIALMFTAQANFSSDLEVDVAMATSAQRKHVVAKAIAQSDKQLIDAWLEDNPETITIPVDVDPYRFIIENYPDKPWRK